MTELEFTKLRLEEAIEAIDKLQAALTRATEEAVQRRQETVAMCDQLRQELQAAQTVWGDKPTVVGWYWYREENNVYMTNIWIIGNTVRAQVQDDEPVDAITLHGEWAGPIPMPREA